MIGGWPSAGFSWYRIVFFVSRSFSKINFVYIYSPLINASLNTVQGIHARHGEDSTNRPVSPFRWCSKKPRISWRGAGRMVKWVLRARSSGDRAAAFEAAGRGFESLRARQVFHACCWLRPRDEYLVGVWLCPSLAH